jgi:hypothetical protein
MGQPKCSTAQHINQGVPPTAGSYLDLAFIRRHVPIGEAARELGVEVLGSRARCWRPENHQNGDRTPSVSFYRNRFKCHCCDERAGSVIDLVVSVVGCDLRGALEWIVRHYSVPQRDPTTRQRWRPTRAGVGGYMWDVVVRSGLLAELPKTAGMVLGVLCGFAEPDQGRCEISYSGLMRYGGIRSRKIISRELRLLEGLSLLNRDRAARAGGFRAPSVYQLHLDASVCSEAVRALRSLQGQGERGRYYLGKSQFPLEGTTGDFDSSPLEGTVKCAQGGISEHADA